MSDSEYTVKLSIAEIVAMLKEAAVCGTNVTWGTGTSSGIAAQVMDAHGIRTVMNKKTSERVITMTESEFRRALRNFAFDMDRNCNGAKAEDRFENNPKQPVTNEFFEKTIKMLTDEIIN